MNNIESVVMKVIGKPAQVQGHLIRSDNVKFTDKGVIMSSFLDMSRSPAVTVIYCHDHLLSNAYQKIKHKNYIFTIHIIIL